MEQPTDLNAYRIRKERENAEAVVRLLAESIRQKIIDLHRTKDLHQTALRRLHALGSTAVTESEQFWLGNEEISNE